MPTYEYLCKKCNNVFEKKMTVDEKKDAKISCEKCGSEDVAQQFFGINVIGGKTSSKKPANGCCGGGGSSCC